jgi:hypothetical protein
MKILRQLFVDQENLDSSPFTAGGKFDNTPFGALVKNMRAPVTAVHGLTSDAPYLLYSNYLGVERLSLKCTEPLRNCLPLAATVSIATSYVYVHTP